MIGQEANPLFFFSQIFLIVGIFYFLLVRPQQKKQKEHNLVIKNLKKGDRVVTSGGILGTVQTLHDDYVVLKVGGGDMKIEVLRSHIADLKNPK